jgi:hypothetical protein
MARALGRVRVLCLVICDISLSLYICIYIEESERDIRVGVFLKSSHIFVVPTTLPIPFAYSRSR